MFEFIIPAVASLLGARMTSGAAKEAAQTSASAADRAADVQRQMFERQVELQEPFRQAGLTAQNRLLDLLGLSGRTGAAGYGQFGQAPSMENFLASPAYRFRLGEGVKALERGAAARGGLMSGAAGKALTRYGQELATTGYGDYLGQLERERNYLLNPLQSILGAGQTATGQQAGYAGQYGANVGNLMMGAGETAANALLSRGGTYGRAFGDIGQLYGRLYGRPSYGGYQAPVESRVGVPVGSITGDDYTGPV